MGEHDSDKTFFKEKLILWVRANIFWWAEKKYTGILLLSRSSWFPSLREGKEAKQNQLIMISLKITNLIVVWMTYNICTYLKDKVWRILTYVWTHKTITSVQTVNRLIGPFMWNEICSVVSDSLQPHGLHSTWNSQVRILEWVAFPFSRESSQPRDQTQVSCIAGGFFTIWATRKDPILSYPGAKLAILKSVKI